MRVRDLSVVLAVSAGVIAGDIIRTGGITVAEAVGIVAVATLLQLGVVHFRKIAKRS